MKKIFSIAMALVTCSCALTAFAGCGGGGGGGGGGGHKEPILVDLDNKITINAMFPSSGMSDSDFSSGWNARSIEQMTGYKVNYTQLGSDGTEAVNTAIKGRDNYHLMKLGMGDFYAHVMQKTGSVMSAEEGAFLDITDYLEIYGKDLLEVIPKESWDMVTYEGRIYGVPETGFSAMIDEAVIYNMDHLKEVGYTTAPDNIKDFTECLEKLQEKYGGDPNYHALGIPGTTPQAFPISAAFEASYKYFIDDNGDVKSYFFDEKLTKYVKYMHGLSDKNILAESFQQQMGNDILSNFAKGNVSVGLMSYWQITPLETVMKDSYGYANPRDSIAWVTSLRGDGTNGSVEQTKAKYNVGAGGGYSLAIPWWKEAEAGYVIDWMNTKIKDENYFKFVMGEEGTHYTVSDTPSEGAIALDDLTGKTRYYTINDRFIKEIKDNSMYQTGGNPKIGTMCWPVREAAFNAWEVLIDETADNMLRDPMGYLSISPAWSIISLAAESNILTHLQNAISSKTNTADAVLEYGRNTFNKKYWTDAVQKELNDMYAAKQAK